MKDSQTGYDLLVRGRNAAAGCSPILTDIMGGESYCGNSLCQLCRTYYPPFLNRSRRRNSGCRSINDGTLTLRISTSVVMAHSAIFVASVVGG